MKMPISVAIKNLNDNLINTINNCNLPACIVEYVVRDIYNDIKQYARKSYEEDLNAYNAGNQE